MRRANNNDVFIQKVCKQYKIKCVQKHHLCSLTGGRAGKPEHKITAKGKGIIIIERFDLTVHGSWFMVHGSWNKKSNEIH